jgi:hypothetical protein
MNLVNQSEKPLESADVRVDLYQNYRFRRATVTVRLQPVLDPGDSRPVLLDADLAGAAAGPAMRCTATRAAYGDGTVDSDAGGS